MLIDYKGFSVIETLPLTFGLFLWLSLSFCFKRIAWSTEWAFCRLSSGIFGFFCLLSIDVCGA